MTDVEKKAALRKRLKPEIKIEVQTKGHGLVFKAVLGKLSTEFYSHHSEGCNVCKRIVVDRLMDQVFIQEGLL